MAEVSVPYIKARQSAASSGEFLGKNRWVFLRRSAGFPALGFWRLSSCQLQKQEHGTGKSREPADRNVCATLDFRVVSPQVRRHSDFPAGAIRRYGSGRSVAWLARLLGVQEVASSNLAAPT